MTADRVVAAARGWLGTPYHHQMAVKGVGCDCLGLVRGVYAEVMGREPETPPPYSPDWAEASGLETMLEAAGRHLLEVGGRGGERLARLRPGDVLIFRMRRGAVAKHAAILVTPRTMIHALERAAVSEVAFAAWWQRRLAAAFRFPGV